jgi:nucleoside phosphorylase
MIQILLVDDNSIKAQKISSILLEIEGLVSDNITIAPDGNTAKSYLSQKVFDLLILDIQIPNRFDQLPIRDGGLKLFQEIKRNKKYFLPQHIIGITAYEESYHEVEPEFSEQLLAVVRYCESSNEWAIKIRRQTENIINSNYAKELSIPGFDYDVAIITAIEKELEAVKRLPYEWKLSNHAEDSTNYYTGICIKGDKQLRVVAASASAMGMTAAAVLSMKLIQHFTPKYLVMLGITAGIKNEDMNYGDILAADLAYDYGSGKVVELEGMPSFLPDPRPINLNTDIKGKLLLAAGNSHLLQEIKSQWAANKPTHSLKVHVGPVASGSFVLAYSPIVDMVKSHNRKLIGLEMETYGVMFAAQNCIKPRPIALSLKSVTDFADCNKSNEFQDYACYTSVVFFHKFITQYMDFDAT